MTTHRARITIPAHRQHRFTRLVGEVARCGACGSMAHTHLLGAANGPLRARVIFIAEAPGRRGAAVTGVPLTRDASGQRFQRFLALAGLNREDCFVTNAVLCNPLDSFGRNRAPAAAERARCIPYLARTLALVDAPVVVTLGRVALEATRAIGPHAASLAEGVGRPIGWQGRTLLPLYHPGRRSTLHRSEAAQEADWHALGALLRALGPGRASEVHSIR